jgi:hypothetical protein
MQGVIIGITPLIAKAAIHEACTRAILFLPFLDTWAGVRSCLAVMVTDYFVSPNDLASAQVPGDIDCAIKVFDAAIRGWLFDHANALTRPSHKNRQHAGFALLFLISSYFEGIEPYFAGSKAEKSHVKWRGGFRRVFPELAAVSDQNIDTIYREVRCGLYHALSGGPRVQIAPTGPAVDVTVDLTGQFVAALLNPWEILTRVQAHFAGYISALKESKNVDIRQRFAANRTVGQPPPITYSAPAMSKWP